MIYHWCVCEDRSIIKLVFFGRSNVMETSFTSKEHTAGVWCVYVCVLGFHIVWIAVIHNITNVF